MPLLTAAGNGDGGNSDAARAEHQRIIEFWTPERVAQAVPRDFVLDPGSGRISPAKKPPGTPGGGNGGDGGSDGGVVSGSSWKKDNAINDSTGKVLFAMSGRYYVCSATAIDDPDNNDRSLILTAAHCVYDEEADQFATEWTFIPDYDNAPEPLSVTDDSYCDATTWGCWTAVEMAVHSEYASAPNFGEALPFDFAVVAVGEGGKGTVALLEDKVTEQGFDFGIIDASNPSEIGHAFGYPAEKKWDGTDLIYCKGPIDTDPLNSGDTYRLNECKLNGGSSGGGWFIDFNENTGLGTVISVNSYRYRGINAMHGPLLDGNTQAVYNAALGIRTQPRVTEVNTDS